MRIYLLVIFLFFIFLEVNALEFNIGIPDKDIFYGKFQGFGGEWDPFFFNDNNKNRGCNDSDWNIITSRLKELKPGIVRIMMQLSWAQSDVNLNNWTWDNSNIQSLFKYLDFCMENDIDVVLTDWGWSVRASQGGLWHPTDNRFALGVAEYIKEFIERRGYTCIKYLVIGNEPDNEIVKEYGIDAYITMYENIDRALKENGTRNLVKLTGPDMGGLWDFMFTSIDRLHNILDAYDYHRYPTWEETGNFNPEQPWENTWRFLDMWRDEINSRDTDGYKKPILVTEMGINKTNWGTYGWGTYEFAIHMADYGTTLLSTRNLGGSAWIMHDIAYFDTWGPMTMGMWKYKDNNWALRPWAQTYGLLMKFSPKNSIQSPVNCSPLVSPPYMPYRCSALKRPDGGWSIFLVNRTTAPVDFNIILPYRSSNNFSKYIVNRNTFNLYPDKLIVPASETIPETQDINITMGPEWFVVLAENTTGFPSLKIEPDSINFGEIVPGSPKSMSLHITNNGSGILFGKIKTDINCLEISTSYFEGNDVSINVTLSNLTTQNTGQKILGKIFIETNAGDVEIPVSFNITCILVRPNPFNPGKTSTLEFYGDGIVPGKTEIKIYSVGGEYIASPDSHYIWDGKTYDGKYPVSGIYIYTYKTKKEKGIGKFTIINKQ